MMLFLLCIFQIGKDIEREKQWNETHWNRTKSLQKPHRRNNNIQGSSGRDFLLKTRCHFLIEVGIAFFPIEILIL